jgi:menaquinol-cytochrome c reductase cytochrome b/c subunit
VTEVQRPPDAERRVDGGRRVMTAKEERRAGYQRYKEDVKERGKPFHPYAMFHDTVMSLVVVSVIIALAVIWKFTADEVPNDSGLLGPLYKDEADPGTTEFVPRPDWYFYFLFYLLRIFKWPESVILGTVGIPTLLIILALVIPFVDVRRERSLLRRPVAIVATVLVVISMGVLTYKGATAREALASEVAAEIPTWIEEGNLVENAGELEGVPPGQAETLVREGAELFAELGCLQCHTYRGTGSANLGAPELTEIGAGDQGVDYFQRYVANPSEFGNTIMPPYASQGEDSLQRVAVFLAASRGSE